MSPKDPTSVQRKARYRRRLRDLGMVRVDTWVPTHADAARILQAAAEMRSQAKAETKTTE